jgi:EAL domain-containing protein (putative c-di-GMP-specific phosphodiesterase class I)
LPLIEKDVAIIELGEFVIKQAVIQMNEWLKIGINMPISVNIAAKQLKNANFRNVLIAILQENGYDNKTSHLEIEIIESAALEDAMLIADLIKTTKEWGISYALDDFGTGHSSLTHLKNLQVDTLKIDKSFIANIIEDTASLAIVESVTALAGAFNKNVIAEGVENIEQTLMLLDIDCDIMQGYAIARPMPIKDATRWIENFSVDPRWSLTDASRPTKQDFNIMLAEANIRYWTENALLYASNIFENRANIDDSEINFQENGFKRWLYNDGVKTYSQFEEFKDIERLFANLDFYATQIIESAKMKNLEQLGQNSLEFKSISAKLVETLRALRAASINSKKLIRERYERI